MTHFSQFNEPPEAFTVHKDSKRGLVCDDVFTFDTEATSYFINPKNGNTETFDAVADDKFRNSSKGKEVGSSLYSDYTKAGVCYIWMLQVLEEVYYGRYIEELPGFLSIISKTLGGARFICFVQNLPYDWQYLINVLNFTDVFAREARKPMYAVASDYNVMFRDAYILNMMSLENVGKKFNLPHAKKSGFLDYNKARTPSTPLTEKELEYCEYDCRCLSDYIKMKATEYGNIYKIPLTQTSEVRVLIKQEIVENSNAKSPYFALKNWQSRMAKMAENTLDGYRRLVMAYMGGYTHANALHTEKILNNVWSYDFTSSYPAVMVAEKYPCTRFIREDPTLQGLDRENRAYIFHIVFDCINRGTNTFISLSKALNIGDMFSCVVDNGRIAEGKGIEMIVTDCDWDVITRAYHITNLKVLEVFSARKKYLPIEILKVIEKLYADKKRYKDEVKKWKALASERELTPEEASSLAMAEANLLNTKQRLNGIYGACVMKTVTTPVEYDYKRDDSGWVPFECPPDFDWNEWQGYCEYMADESLKEGNSHLLFNFAWGVWVSAYARRNLWEGILANGDGIAYSDTDSMKGLESYSEKAAGFVSEYNSAIDEKIKASCLSNDLDFETLRGLGRFDFEGVYDRFTTLGAKKYACEKGGELEITVSGVNKKSAVYDKHEHTEKLDRLDKLEDFKPGKVWGARTSGRLIRYYIDDQPPRVYTDYLGNSEEVYQKHAVCLQPSSYHLGITDDYEDFVNELQQDADAGVTLHPGLKLGNKL